MFVGYKGDGSVYGLWTSPQPDDADHPGIVEREDDHPDVIAFLKSSETVLVSVANKDGSSARSRKSLIEDVERRMSLGAPQAEINEALLKLLKE